MFSVNNNNFIIFFCSTLHRLESKMSINYKEKNHIKKAKTVQILDLHLLTAVSKQLFRTNCGHTSNPACYAEKLNNREITAMALEIR